MRLIRYHNVRIDAVHYCEREIDLAEKRKRRFFFDRNGDPKDAPMQRLQLFSRSVRENQFQAVQVRYLKMPYMTRESCKADLARTISVLPNLRYVDLPEGFFSDDPSCDTLRQELQSRCGDIRRMRYCAGGEGSFTMLERRRQWQNLEVLELSHLGIEPATLVNVLASFPALHEVKLDSLPLLDDIVFSHNPETAPFPPLASLTLENTPNVSADGLVAYLSRKDTREVFTAIRLVNTGILASILYNILAVSPYLSTVHVSENVSRALPKSSLPTLSSSSLKSLNYEISSSTASPRNRHSPRNLQDPSKSYYLYLSTSILSGGLPSLTSLYALSTALPSLLLPLPSAPFASSQAPVAPSPGVSRPLDLFTKSISELEWEYTLITPPTSTNRRGSATQTRPLSLQLGPQWGSKARDSVMVGNGFGGFLAVPSEEAVNPGSSGGRAHKKKGKEWMG